jgi:hypothetical protein
VGVILAASFVKLSVVDEKRPSEGREVDRSLDAREGRGMPGT